MTLLLSHSNHEDWWPQRWLKACELNDLWLNEKFFDEWLNDIHISLWSQHMQLHLHHNRLKCKCKLRIGFSQLIKMSHLCTSIWRTESFTTLTSTYSSVNHVLICQVCFFFVCLFPLCKNCFTNNNILRFFFFFTGMWVSSSRLQCTLFLCFYIVLLG